MAEEMLGMPEARRVKLDPIKSLVADEANAIFDAHGCRS
jgi:hypothetical protein